MSQYNEYDADDYYPEDGEFLDEGDPPPYFLGVEWTPIRLLIAFAAGALALFGVGFFFVMRPQLNRLQTLDSDVRQKTAQLNESNQRIESLDGVEEEISSARIVNEQVSAFLPTPDTLETQLLEVNRLIEQSNASLQSFEPGDVSPAGAEVPAAIQPQISRSTTRVSVNGSFDAGVQLMNNLERLTTLLQVSDVDLDFDFEADELTTEFTLGTYVYDASIPPAPVAPPTEEAQEG
ncbi:MAG: hypothetical protein AAFX40_02660 [Cyanobacteria bacterium J06639_1]